MGIRSDLDELNDLTDIYLGSDGGKPYDTLHQQSYMQNYFNKQKKGLYKIVPGATQFDLTRMVGGVFSRSFGREDATIVRNPAATAVKPATSPDNSGDYDAKVAANVAFQIRHIISSVLILRDDKKKNQGSARRIDLVKTRTDALMKIHAESRAKGMYWPETTDNTAVAAAQGYQRVADGILFCGYNGDPAEWQGDYGGVASAAGWLGRRDTTAEQITFTAINKMRRTAKIKDGPGGRPDITAVPEELFGSLQTIAGTLIRLGEDKTAAKFGFLNIVHEGGVIVADDFVPAGYACSFNTALWGLHFLEGGNGDRTDWELVPGSAQDFYMDIMDDFNYVTPARDAHIVHTHFAA